jgi:hypothetical protein
VAGKPIATLCRGVEPLAARLEEAPRRHSAVARRRPYARYRPTSRLAFLVGVGLHLALRRAVPEMA